MTTKFIWVLALGVWLGAACGSAPPGTAAPTASPPPPASATPTLAPATPTAAPTASPSPTLLPATATPTPAAPLATLPPTPTRRPAAANTPLPTAAPLTADNAAGLVRLARWPVKLAPEALQFSSSGRSLWVTGAGQTEVWRTRDGVRIRRERGPALSPDGLLRLDTVGVAAAETGGADSLFYILTDLRAGQERIRWPDAKPAVVTACGLNECGRLLFAPNSGTVAEIEDFTRGRERPTLKLWSLDGQLIRTAPGIQALAYSPDGTLLLTRRPTTPPIDIWRVRDGGLLKSLAPGRAVSQMALAPDNARLALADDTQVQIWRWTVGDQEGAWPALGLTSLAFNADGSLLFGGFADHFEVWSVPDGTRLAQFALPAGAGPLTVSADGRFVAVAADGALEVWGVPAQP